MAYAGDLKSPGRKAVWVRLPPRVPRIFDSTPRRASNRANDCAMLGVARRYFPACCAGVAGFTYKSNQRSISQIMSSMDSRAS